MSTALKEKKPGKFNLVGNFTRYVTEMWREQAYESQFGDSEHAEKLQRESDFAERYPVFSFLQMNIRQILGIPSDGMQSALRNTTRENLWNQRQPNIRYIKSKHNSEYRVV